MKETISNFLPSKERKTKGKKEMNYARQCEKANQSGDSRDRAGERLLWPAWYSPAQTAKPMAALSLHIPFFPPRCQFPTIRFYFILGSQPQTFNKANSFPVVIREMELAPPLTSTLPHTHQLPQATDLCGQCPCSHSPGHIAGAWC